MKSTPLRCYLKSVKQDPSFQSAISLFRRWQKNHEDSDDYYCHMCFEDGKPCLSTEAESILSHSIPELSVYSLHSILSARTEEWMGAPTETDVVDNNVLLESIVNDIFKNDVDDGDGGEMSVDGDMK